MIKRIKLESRVLEEKSIKEYSISTLINNKYLRKFFYSFLPGETEDQKNDQFIKRVNLVYNKLFNSITNGKIKIYREMKVENDYIDHLEKQGKHLGVYWTLDKSSVGTYFDSGYEFTKDTIKIIIESEIQEKYINWDITIKMNIDLTVGNKENEIRLFKGTPLKIISIESDGRQLDINKIKDKIFYA